MLWAQEAVLINLDSIQVNTGVTVSIPAYCSQAKMNQPDANSVVALRQMASAGILMSSLSQADASEWSGISCEKGLMADI